MIFEFPFLPPSVNACYRTFKGKVVKSAKLKAYEQEVLHYFDEQDDISMMSGKLKLSVQFYMKGKRTIDLDNMLKALIDGLENILFENDRNIIEIHAVKYNNCNEIKTIVQLEQIETQDYENPVN
jgi:Holliday junction resolvase RusA-like endonuclease